VLGVPSTLSTNAAESTSNSNSQTNLRATIGTVPSQLNPCFNLSVVVSFAAGFPTRPVATRAVAGKHVCIHSHRKAGKMDRFTATSILLLYFSALSVHGFLSAPLDGSGNNIAKPNWGKAGGAFSKLSPLTLRYTDGFSSAVQLPNPRNIVRSIGPAPSHRQAEPSASEALAYLWRSFSSNTRNQKQHPP